MDPNLLYTQFWQQLASCNDMTTEYRSSLRNLVYDSFWQNRFSEPMPLIGMYIALASLFCTLAMMADLFHGLRNRKFWFPCKYFTLNAASLTVIAIAVKLPMDLTNQTQDEKIGSMAFMCTMMSSLLPSLATMDTKELVSNIIALGVLVITLVVNVCIQISTGAFSYRVDNNMRQEIANYAENAPEGFVFEAIIYVGLLLMLLVLYASTSIAILMSKQILESKYQSALKDQELQQPGRLTVEKLKQLVRNCWIMAETGSPQFMTACYATTSVSGVICAFSSIIYFMTMLYTIRSQSTSTSDYKWSMIAILIIQYIGVMVGAIAPICRCFAALSFKLSVKWIWNLIKVFKVESYWIQKLSDWKHSSIPLPSRRRNWKIIIQNLKSLILCICIGFQKLVVIACKIIALIPVFLVICVLYNFHCWKWLKAMFSNALGIVLVEKPDQLGSDVDLSRYVLKLQDEMEFPERTLKGITKSVNHLIKKAEKQHPKNLMNLLAESRGFEGVKNFDSHHVRPLLSEEYPNCWSLPLVTLTSIAMSLPNIQRNILDSLLSGVNEGLVYVTLVEESLNDTDDHAIIQRVAKTLWLEVEVYHKWLGNRLQKPAPQANTTKQILQWLSDTAKNIVTEVESRDIGGQNDNSKWKSIAANSMYRMTETILLSYNVDIDQLSQEELFEQLSSMMADILAACLTNLPQIITRKCHTNVIEKREANVHSAALLLGETTQIINTLQDRELPSLNLDDLAFIDKWHDYLNNPFP